MGRLGCRVVAFPQGHGRAEDFPLELFAPILASWGDQLGPRLLLYPPQKIQISPLKTIPVLCPHTLLASSPALTWRDLQHLIIRASKPAHLQAEDWAENGVGRRGECRAQPLQPLPAAPGGTWRGSRAPLSGATCVPVSHYYGYGLLDAGLLVQAATTWTGTRPQQKCSVQAVQLPR